MSGGTNQSLVNGLGGANESLSSQSQLSMDKKSTRRCGSRKGSRAKIRRLDQHSFLEGCDFGLDLMVVREDQDEDSEELFDDDDMINLNDLGAGR